MTEDGLRLPTVIRNHEGIKSLVGLPEGQLKPVKNATPFALVTLQFSYRRPLEMLPQQNC